MMSLPNEGSGVDAGGALCLHIGRPRPGATHRERYTALARMGWTTRGTL
jgi:hypothetical protein